MFITGESSGPSEEQQLISTCLAVDEAFHDAPSLFCPRTLSSFSSSTLYSSHVLTYISILFSLHRLPPSPFSSSRTLSTSIRLLCPYASRRLNAAKISLLK